MDKAIDKVIESIIHLPFEFSHKNKSAYTLLKESGYFELYNQVNEAEIITKLKEYPNSIKLWLSWAENKRSNLGWYFTKSDDGKYFVGYYPEGKESEEISTSDEFKACAAFIKREIESIRL